MQRMKRSSFFCTIGCSSGLFLTALGLNMMQSYDTHGLVKNRITSKVEQVNL